MGIGLAGMIALAWMSRSLVTTVAGVEEALELQTILRGTQRAIVEEDPPLRVLRVPASEAWPGWRWKVEATLRSDPAPAPAEVERGVRRMVERALLVKVQGHPPSGVILVLRRAGAPEEERLLDGKGLPVKAAPR